MSFSSVKRLKVFFSKLNVKILVGELYRSDTNLIFFEYDRNFSAQGIQLSPIKLPLKTGIFTPKENIFDGLFGLFADSLPDGWGMLLMKRHMRQSGIKIDSTSALDRLSYIGSSGMGALTYEPVCGANETDQFSVSLSELARQSQEVLAGTSEEVLERLYILGGSPGGARPKVLVSVNDMDLDGEMVSGSNVGESEASNLSPWIVKFTGTGDGKNSGIIEYIYSLTAKKIGLEMESCHLFKDENNEERWFGTKRFDRRNRNKIHTHTLAGLLNSDFRIPSLDYSDVIKAVDVVTKGSQTCILSAFRLAAFNAIFHNRDDHGKNFSFIFDRHDRLKFSPVYDLTYSVGAGGEHATSFLGKGKDIQDEDLLKLGLGVGISKKVLIATIEEVKSGRSIMLDLLKQYQVKLPELSSFLRK